MDKKEKLLQKEGSWTLCIAMRYLFQFLIRIICS